MQVWVHQCRCGAEPALPRCFQAHMAFGKGLSSLQVAQSPSWRSRKCVHCAPITDSGGEMLPRVGAAHSSLNSTGLALS